MAKTKAEILKEAKDLGLEASSKNTIAEIEQLIKDAAKTDKVAEPKESSEKKTGEPGEEVETDETTAKAGKRSAKALAEAEEKAKKEERKAEGTAETEKPKISQKPARSRLERRGKKYRETAKLIDKLKSYKLDEALDLACKTSTAKFDATVEIHVRLGVDPKQADQNIRDSVVLPSGSGKTTRIAVFADEVNAKKAKTAGADFAGEDDLLAKLDKEQIDFDVLIAMPSLMSKLAKYARVLGPKGLMPNPKSGTVTADVVKAIQQAKAGKIEYRVDSNGIIHCGIGKVSFGTDKLKANADALIASIKQNKPSSIKNAYIKSIYLVATMGPSVAIEISEL